MDKKKTIWKDPTSHLQSLFLKSVEMLVTDAIPFLSTTGIFEIERLIQSCATPLYTKQ